MGMVDYKEILRATNKGLDIIVHYYPEAAHAIHKNPPKFKVRKEKTASASIRLKDNADIGEPIYYVTDFGGEKKERHAIQICMHEDNLGFKEACDKLGYDFGISAVAPETSIIKPDMNVRPMKGEETGCDDVFNYADDADPELLQKVFGPLVEPGDLYFCNCKQVISYTLYRKGKAIEISATPECPIFVFDYGTWKKIYQPYNTDKGFKFSYSGNKPAKFVFGLDAVEQDYHARKKQRDHDVQNNKLSAKQLEEEWRGDVFIMSGGSDGINMKSTGRLPIWFNSESEMLASSDYKNLREWCANVYYVADLDRTGIRQAIATGMKYLNVKLVFLPGELMMERGSNGSKSKDFKDFIRNKCRPGKEAAFEYLLESILVSSMPMCFWYYQGGKYQVAHSQAFQFLYLNGIGKIEDKNLQEGFRYIHVDGNVVREINPVEIETKLLKFLEERRQPIKLRDLFIKSAQLSPKQLNKLPYIQLDFQTTGPDFQYFFFKNKVLKVMANNIEASKHGDGDIYAWEEKVNNFNYRDVDPFFKITLDNNEELDIDVFSNDCMFFNFIINTSRIHWQKDLETSFSDPLGAEALAYDLKNRFNIAGPNLGLDEIQEQKLHLINKIYAIGYLFHEYKVMNRAYAIYAMDNKIGSQGESNGGSGKSLCWGQMWRFLNRHYIPSRNRKSVEDNQFVYDGVSKKTDYVLFDDAHEYFSIDFFFSEITDGMRVNPKHGTPFEIPFLDSPKFVVSSNHAPKLDRSAERRLLFTVFSDYYHYKKDDDEDYLQHRTVADDFGGKQLFTDWDDQEHNRFMNFIIQCVQFYLRHPHKVNPPMGNVSKRNLLHEMQSTFVDWAKDAFYTETSNSVNVYLDNYVSKADLYESFIKDTGLLKSKYKAATFKKNVERYCRYNNWVFNPQHLLTDHKNRRIMKNNEEYFYLQTAELKSPEEASKTFTKQSPEDALKDMFEDEK
jgi:hypothetical protein